MALAASEDTVSAAESWETGRVAQQAEKNTAVRRQAARASAKWAVSCEQIHLT